MDERSEIANQLAHYTLSKEIRGLMLRFQALENVLELYQPENHVRYLRELEELTEKDDGLKFFDDRIKYFGELLKQL